jgi:Protein of unknown function (DUF1570)
MRRWLLATGAFLLVATVPAHADYVIIKINLAAARDRDTQAAQQQPGFPNAPGGRGMPGGRFGPQGGGAGIMGGQGGPGRGGFGQGPAMGMRGGMGIMGMQAPGGTQNMMQMQNQRMQQQMMRGGMMGNPMMGMMGMQGGEEEESDPIHVRAIVEVEKADINKRGQATGNHVRIRHKWGATHLAYPAADLQWTIYNRLDTVAKRFAGKKAEIKEDDPDRARRLLELAQWALEHDLIGSPLPPPNPEARPTSPVDQVAEVMAELARIDSRNPIVLAFQTVQKQIERKPSQDDPVLSWKDKLEDFKRKSSDHYTVLYDERNTSTDSADVDRCLARLEHNYKGFYYWFALRGKVLSAPDYRLIAFLVHDKNTFDSERTGMFDNPAMVEAAFFSPRDDLAVFSGARSDEAFQALETLLKPYWDTRGQPDVLLKAKGRSAGGGQYAQLDDEKARAETMELVHKAMKEESLLAAISYEGTRQLVTASGLLPRGVEPPQWIDFGLASFLETPMGAYWPGIGGPNMHYLARIQVWAMRKDKNLEPDALEALQAVVTDRYFQEIKDARTKEDEKTRQSQVNRARIMAWALTFYLAQNHCDGLIRYYQELANMPRDLKFDREALLGAFARAFNLGEPGNPSTLDRSKADVFARKWYAHIKNAVIEVDTLRRDYEESQKKPEKPGSEAGSKPANPGADK